MTSILDGYGLGGPKGCVIDLADPELRAATIEDGIIWYTPRAAQEAACEDIASGRVPDPREANPDYVMPEWASNTIATLRQMREPEPVPAVPPDPHWSIFDEPKPRPATGPGWTCTEHEATPLVLTSRKGRTYRCCSVMGCPQFERAVRE